MEDAHPIPKNLMDVEFKLFGSMTLKQFASLVVWLFVALFFYLINLPPIIGYPIIGFNIFMGIAFAFLKVGDQPFPKWLTNFLIAILTPQRKVWRKDNSVPKILQTNFAKPNKNIAPKADKQADALIDEIISKNRPRPIEDYQSQNIEKQKQAIKDSMSKDSIIENFKKNNSFKIPEHNQVSINQAAPAVPNEKSEIDKNNVTQKSSEESVKIENQNETPLTDQENKQTKEPVVDDSIPEQESKQAEPQNTVNQNQPQVKKEEKPIEKTNVSMNNMVSGRVINAQGSAEVGIDVLVLNEKKEPVRTIKTNNQGLFKLNTPLEDGKYFISAKKEGQKFQAIETELDGSFEKILTIYEI